MCREGPRCGHNLGTRALGLAGEAGRGGGRGWWCWGAGQVPLRRVRGEWPGRRGVGGSLPRWSFLEIPAAVSIQTPTANESPLVTSCPRERGSPPGEGRRVPRPVKFGSFEKFQRGPAGQLYPQAGFRKGVSRTRGLSLLRVRGRWRPLRPAAAAGPCRPADLGLAEGLRRQGPAPHGFYFLAPWVPESPSSTSAGCHSWAGAGWGFTPPQGLPRLPSHLPGSRQEGAEGRKRASPGLCGYRRSPGGTAAPAGNHRPAVPHSRSRDAVLPPPRDPEA